MPVDNICQLDQRSFRVSKLEQRREGRETWQGIVGAVTRENTLLCFHPSAQCSSPISCPHPFWVSSCPFSSLCHSRQAGWVEVCGLTKSAIPLRADLSLVSFILLVNELCFPPWTHVTFSSVLKGFCSLTVHMLHRLNRVKRYYTIKLHKGLQPHRRVVGQTLKGSEVLCDSLDCTKCTHTS